MSDHFTQQFEGYLREFHPNRLNIPPGSGATPGSSKNPVVVVDGDENVDPSPAGKTKPAAAKAAFSAGTKKRKSDSGAEFDKERMFPDELIHMDDDDPRLSPYITETCNAVRRKIRTFIETGAMKVGEFQKMIGVSPAAYANFMNRTGAHDGDGCALYHDASLYFQKREVLGLPLKGPGGAKKAKTSKSAGEATGTAAAGGKKKEPEDAAAVLDVSGIELDGEESGSVPVFDTCDEVRKKIRALLTKHNISQAAFVRALGELAPEGRKPSAANLRYFMGQKGPRSGNTSGAFYAAYLFFEKRRIKDNKPKSKFRLEMEYAHGWQGMDVVHGANTSYLVSAHSRPYVDKYGKISIF